MPDSVNLSAFEQLDDPRLKRLYNQALFHRVAPRYDVVTRGLSLGRDATWKRWLIAALPDRPAPVCFDLACGTGDLTLQLARRYPDGSITGLDLCPAMLARAKQRKTPGPVHFRQGDLGALPVPDASVDVVTGGYALRNAPDLGAALDEVVRVLRPGGTAAFLDFSRPDHAASAAMAYALLKTWGSAWGLMMHGQPAVYGYIAESLKRYPGRKTLRELFCRAGLEPNPGRRLFGGMLELLVAQKPY